MKPFHYSKKFISFHTYYSVIMHNRQLDTYVLESIIIATDNDFIAFKKDHIIMLMLYM